MRWTRIVPVLMLSMLLVSPGWVVAQGTSSSGMFGNRTTGGGISPGSSSAFGSNSPLSNLGQNGAGFHHRHGRERSGGPGAASGQLHRCQYGPDGPAELRRRGPSQHYRLAIRRRRHGRHGWNGHGWRWHGIWHGGNARTALAQGGLGNNTQATPPIRTTLTLPPDLAVAAVPQGVSLAIAQHLGALPALHWQAPAQVEMQGRTAILRGVVATEHDRDLAERVVRLEATVDQVQNQIVVAGQTTPKSAPTVERLPAAGSSAAGSSARAPTFGRTAPVAG